MKKIVFQTIIVLIIAGCVSQMQIYKKQYPKSKEEAFSILDTLLSTQDKDQIKNSRKDNLINYHFSLGMYIRNHFGLWAGNEMLSESFEIDENTHPDDISGIILDQYWEYLNRNDDKPSFSDDPAEYFQQVFDIISKKKVQKYKYLPKWVFKERPSHMRNSYFSADFNDEIINYAEKNKDKESDKRYLYFLFLEEFANKSTFLPILETLLHSNNITNYTPIENYSNNRFNRLKLKSCDNTLLESEIALALINDLLEKEFDSADKYFQFAEKVKNNYYLFWCYKSEITDDDIDSLMQDPIKLSKLIILCRKDNINIIEEKLGLKLLSNYETNYCPNLEIIHKLLNKQPIEQVYKSIVEPDSTYPHELSRPHKSDYMDYDDYRYEVIQLFHSDFLKENYGNLWDTYINTMNQCQYFPQKGEIIEKLFEVDRDKMDELINQMFKVDINFNNSSQGFRRSYIVEAIIKNYFNEYEEFLYNWYFVVQEHDYKYFGNEISAMYKTIYQYNREHIDFIKKIRNDKRFDDSNYVDDYWFHDSFEKFEEYYLELEQYMKDNSDWE